MDNILYIERCSNIHEDNDAKLNYATEESAGVDIAFNEVLSLVPGQKKLIGTGLKFRIPKGMVGLLVPRSSAGKVDFSLANTVVIIDSDYQDEVKIFAKNNSGSQMVYHPGDYMCQIVFIKVERLKFAYVDKLPEVDSTRDGGFGSTDKKKK